MPHTFSLPRICTLVWSDLIAVMTPNTRCPSNDPGRSAQRRAHRGSVRGERGRARRPSAWRCQSNLSLFLSTDLAAARRHRCCLTARQCRRQAGGLAFLRASFVHTRGVFCRIAQSTTPSLITACPGCDPAHMIGTGHRRRQRAPTQSCLSSLRGCTARQCSALHRAAPHCTAPHCTAPHCTAQRNRAMWLQRPPAPKRVRSQLTARLGARVPSALEPPAGGARRAAQPRLAPASSWLCGARAQRGRGSCLECYSPGAPCVREPLKSGAFHAATASALIRSSLRCCTRTATRVPAGDSLERTPQQPNDARRRALHAARRSAGFLASVHTLFPRGPARGSALEPSPRHLARLQTRRFSLAVLLLKGAALRPSLHWRLNAPLDMQAHHV
jgi:hypothetical protein